MATVVPSSHRDLVEAPPVAALTTLMPHGGPHTSVVWCDSENGVVRINTMRGFQKERNMRRDPRVTLLCYDPQRPLRYLEVRGTVTDMTEGRALPMVYCRDIQVRPVEAPRLTLAVGRTWAREYGVPPSVGRYAATRRANARGLKR